MFIQRWKEACLEEQLFGLAGVFPRINGESLSSMSLERASSTYVTALVPSETACLASSPGNNNRTAVWISRDEIVWRLLYWAKREASPAIRSWERRNSNVTRGEGFSYRKCRWQNCSWWTSLCSKCRYRDGPNWGRNFLEIDWTMDLRTCFRTL